MNNEIVLFTDGDIKQPAARSVSRKNAGSGSPFIEQK